MNVALIIERIETWRGGAETSTMQFAEHLAELGCHVHMITTSYPPSTPSLTIVPLYSGKGLRALRTRSFIRKATNYVRENRFDIVHCITPCPAADIYQPRGGTLPETLERNLALRDSAWRRGLKSIAQRLNLKYRVLAELERNLLQRRPPPWVIAISAYVARQLQDHYDFASDHVRLIFNGVNPDTTPSDERAMQRAQIRRQFGCREEDLMILSVAHNFRLKGIGTLVRALAEPALTGHTGPSATSRTLALIVGRDNPAPFVKQARALGVADRVLFTGPTPRVQAFFHAADVLVHDTYYDPCSRVVLEAMSAGLPVITTKYNGAAELITDGQEGYVLDSPEDSAALAAALRRLSDPEHRQACARRAPRAVEHVTMRRHAETVYGLYEELLRTGEIRTGGYR